MRSFDITPARNRRPIRQNVRPNRPGRPNRSGRPNRPGRPDRSGRPNHSGRPNRRNAPPPEYLRQAAQMPRAEIRLKNLTTQDVHDINNQLRRQPMIQAPAAINRSMALVRYGNGNQNLTINNQLRRQQMIQAMNKNPSEF